MFRTVVLSDEINFFDKKLEEKCGLNSFMTKELKENLSIIH